MFSCSNLHPRLSPAAGHEEQVVKSKGKAQFQNDFNGNDFGRIGNAIRRIHGLTGCSVGRNMQKIGIGLNTLNLTIFIYY